MKKTPEIVNVEKKGFPEDALDRLAAADKAISAMVPDERVAAFNWMRSKFAAEWPRDPY